MKLYIMPTMRNFCDIPDTNPIDKLSGFNVMRGSTNVFEILRWHTIDKCDECELCRFMSYQTK